jgi:formamidopyrimidine-DNA glycosylase
MPELPDVETFRCYFDSTSLEKEILEVEVADPQLLKNTSPRKLKSVLNSNRFKETRRHGKYLFAHLSDGHWLVLHFGMTGFLKYFKHPNEKPRHVRLMIRFANDHCLAYDCLRRFGQIHLIDSLETFIREKRLGPDALDPQFDFDAFESAFSGTGATAKSALMDQNRIAGIGNIYSDEILFQAGIHPRRKVDDLGGEDIRKVYKAIKKTVLPKAIQCGSDPEKFPDSFLLTRRKKGGKCRRCGGIIQKSTIAGRTSYFCPHCQPE